MGLTVVDLTPNPIPDVRFDLPLVEQDRGGVVEETLGCESHSHPRRLILIEVEDRFRDPGGGRRLPTRLRALDQDRADGLQTASKLAVHDARTKCIAMSLLFA